MTDLIRLTGWPTCYNFTIIINYYYYYLLMLPLAFPRGLGQLPPPQLGPGF
jgi:hypothetical protein